jgi:hypothetical protein
MHPFIEFLYGVFFWAVVMLGVFGALALSLSVMLLFVTGRQG